MEKDFERAAEMSPCILFVDEIDAIGSRTEDGEGAQHSQWVRWTVNHLLALMDGFSKSRKVVVLGATNHAVKVDPALRRSGRLDRTIRIPLPNRPALVAIYSHYLSAASHNLSAVDVDELGQCSVGMSGADVERFVREGRRRARNRKRPLILPDILESIYATPPEEARIALLPDELESTAWHEAGHAVMMWSGPERAVGLNYISIVPRPDGTLGFMAQSSREGQHSFTRAKLVHELAVLLGGRAAEEIRFGKEGVSSGCISDLRVASNLGMDIVGRLGLGAAGRLATPYGERAHQELADDVEAELQSAYSTALATLSEHQPLLERIATALIDKSEISGAEFKRIATAYQLETARAKGRL
jgi:ATP-dependent Zn protease